MKAKALIATSTVIAITLAAVWIHSLKSENQNRVVKVNHVDINTCSNTPSLVSIDIGKSKLFSKDTDRFRFYAKLINPSVEPSEMLYRWVVRPPEGSKISTSPQITTRMLLEPDVWGTYHIVLTLGDKSGRCRHGIYVFNYPELDSQPKSLPLILQAGLL